jgi:hypothetical protein
MRLIGSFAGAALAAALLAVAPPARGEPMTLQIEVTAARSSGPR